MTTIMTSQVSLSSIYNAFPLKTFPPVYSPPRVYVEKNSPDAAHLSVVSDDIESSLVVSGSARPDSIKLISKVPTMYVYGPGWKMNWPSFDVDCLVWQAYLRFSKVKFEVINCNEPLMSPSGKLPFLVTERGRVFAEKDRMMHYISTKHGNLNKRLSDLEKSQSAMFISLIENKLNIALLYTLWCESQNYEADIKPMYSRGYIWPLDSLIMMQKKKEVTKFLKRKLDSINGEEIYREAARALEALSLKLGDNHYIFHDSPSFVDALLFSHLHVILSASLPISTLRTLAMEYKNLTNYTKRIWTTWFKDEEKSNPKRLPQ